VIEELKALSPLHMLEILSNFITHGAFEPSSNCRIIFLRRFQIHYQDIYINIRIVYITEDLII
jgi:hypothetical protein